MDTGEGPSDSGRPHATPGLGPHVVGQRVVVRRVLRGLTGPTGGPAFTDVLGVCERWDTRERCALLRREDGSTVRIALDDIVSGKPVPPRPSPRLRITAREAEEHALSTWPRLDVARLGDWVLRSDPLLTPGERLVKRANSCLAMGDPGVPLIDALTDVSAFYAVRDRPALLQVETGSATDTGALGLGWRPLTQGAATFLMASVARALRALPPGLPEVGLVEVEREARVETAGVRARAVLDGDWLGIHDLAVEPAHRRRRLASAALHALLDWGASQGALTAWLHVEVGNAAAVSLYERLGFVAHHSYRYLLAPGADVEALGPGVGVAHTTPGTGA